jgi:predicted SAM-dependent methyltransferase
MIAKIGYRPERNLAPNIKPLVKANFPTLVSIIRALRHFTRVQISRSRVRRLLRTKKEIYLEVGAGNKKGQDGWVTIDLTKLCDVYWDLRRGLPFPSESIAKIYSSHFLEHLSFKEGQSFLDDCLRVLVPGGTFSICVPNAKLYIEAYLELTPLDKGLFLSYKPAYNNTTKIDYVNYTAYMDGHHKYMFDEENLLYVLKSKGFRNVKLREFDPGLDLEVRHYESIYAEAQK